MARAHQPGHHSADVDKALSVNHLTPRELEALTKARTLRKQIAALVRLGVPFRFGGGEVEVSRDVARELPQWRIVEASRAPRLDMVR